jgi:hypothetical protein
MAQYCIMVKGPCRGKSCDFWARVKIRKLSMDELVTDIRDCVEECKNNNSMKLDDALRKYWFHIGIQNLDRLCNEEPDLCAKMIDAEVRAQI